MALMKKIHQHLDSTSDLLWDTHADADFAALADKVSSLNAAIAVHRALEVTAQNLQGSTLPYAQSRLGKFLDAIYGPGDGKKAGRLQKLQSLSHQEFIYTSMSYTPLDIVKMSRIEFQCLLQTIPVYLTRRNLPSRWIFRDEIQVSIATRASVRNTAEFRKGYYALEFQQDSDIQSPPAKRTRLGNSPIMNIARHSRRIENLAEHAEQRDQERSCMPTAVALSEIEQPSSEEPRKIVFQCLGATVDKLEQVLAGKSLLDAVKGSRQWQWERSRDTAANIAQTDCLIAMMPDSDQDISIMIRVGYTHGWSLSESLEFQRSIALGM